MPIWFIAFLAVCACFAFVGAIRSIRAGMYIGGEKVSPLTIILAMIGVLIAFGFFAATQLGFIRDHAS